MGLRSSVSRLAAAIALTAGFGWGAQAAEMGATNEPIKLAMNEWTGQHITTKVAGEILERMGYQVDTSRRATIPK
jgi:glycine betaine/proline transport system substrate-binding protein